MKVFITGSNGLLGQYVTRKMADAGADLLLCGIEPESVFPEFQKFYRKMDVTDHNHLKESLQSYNPDYVINCAAYTNVDGCETERDRSWRINVKSVESLAQLTRIFHFHLIQISTDYIFDGSNGPYDEEDTPNPLSYYGKEKLAAENAVRSVSESYTIVRTNVLYGYNSGKKLNFVTWLLTELMNNRDVKIVDDQYNNATFAGDLSTVIHKICDRGIQGIYHVGGLEYESRYDMANMICKCCGLSSTLVHRISTEELNQAAARPKRGGLKIEKAKKDLQFQPVRLATAVRNIFDMIKQDKAG